MEYYYKDQTGWGAEEFYSLNRFLNKLFLNHIANWNEIKRMDLSRMTRETRVIMLVILLFQNKQEVLHLPNFINLINEPPLESLLRLVEEPTNCHEIYVKYNIGL